MADTKNALEDLAKQLGMFADFNRDADRVNGYVITKAKRIVAELAKVSEGHWEVVCDGTEAYICKAGSTEVQCSIGVCRSIAEEGATNV